MKLWILRPVKGLKNDPWDPWYDKAFGFVIRAETEEEARKVANADAGDEVQNYQKPFCNPWLEETQSTCVELTAEGDAGLIMRDFAAA